MKLEARNLPGSNPYLLFTTFLPWSSIQQSLSTICAFYLQARPHILPCLYYLPIYSLSDHPSYPEIQHRPNAEPAPLPASQAKVYILNSYISMHAG